MFTCKGCREEARLVGEVEDIRQVLETMKRMITGQGLEEESGETGDQVAGREETEEKEKCSGSTYAYVFNDLLHLAFVFVDTGRGRLSFPGHYSRTV